MGNDIIDALEKLNERFTNLKLDDLESKNDEELGDSIEEFIKITDELNELEDQARAIEESESYDVDKMNQFRRAFMDFQDDIKRTSSFLAKNVSELFEKLKEAKSELSDLKSEMYALNNKKREIDRHLSDINKNLDNHQKTIKNIQELIAKKTSKGEDVESLNNILNQNQSELNTLNDLLTSFNAQAEVNSREIARVEPLLKSVEKKYGELKSRIRKIKGDQREISREAENNLEDRERVGIFDTDIGGDNIPDSREESAPSSSEVETPAENMPAENARDNSVENDADLEPINDTDTIEIIDGKEYILELDKEATMQNYGFGQNAVGWYFDPSKDEYEEDYDPLKDPLNQIFVYYEVVNVVDKEATMQNYRNSYGQNAFGWYFNPSKDEYEEDYDPLKDPLFQVFEKKKKYIGKGPKGKIPNRKELPIEEDPIPVEPDPNPREEKIEKHLVTIKITGPEDKETSVVIEVEDGEALFPLGPDGLTADSPQINKFYNVCVEAFGQASDYKIKSFINKPNEFNMHTTPITEDISLDVMVGKYHRVQFNNDGEVLYSTLVEEGSYLDPNLVELLDKAVNYGYDDINDVDYLKQPKNKRDGNALKKAFTGLKYWGLANTGTRVGEKAEKFKFNQPIMGETVLEAQTGIKAKSVLSTAAGLATGAAIDLAGGPVAGKIGIAGATVADRVAKYKLNHHKEMIRYEEINKMTGIKKASARLTNYFRKTQTIKDLQYFMRGLIIGASTVEVGRAVKDITERVIAARNPQPQVQQPTPGDRPHPTPQHSSTSSGVNNKPTLKSGDAFEYGYRDSYNAVSGSNNVHLDTSIAEKSTPTQFYDTVNKKWLPINDSTLSQVASEPSRYGVKYMSQAGNTMWESAAEALENVGGVVK